MTTDSTPNRLRPRLWRSRWAAIGAAVAVTLGGGGLFVANAASSAPSSVVTIDPVRILDTRTDVGLDGPFVSGESQKLQVTGPVPTTTGTPPGTQTPVPLGATGVLLNVTVVRPSTDGFLSVRPGDATGSPETSSLNFTAGTNVPNSVQVGLPTAGANAGQIDIVAGGQAEPTTEVLIDVVGYMVEGASDRSAAVTSQKDFEVVLLDVFEVVVSLPVTAPVAGQVTVFSTTAVGDATANGTTSCYITTLETSDPGFLQRWNSPGNPGRHAQLSGVRTFDIAAGATVDYNLVCKHGGAGAFSNLESTVISAIFTPAAPTP
jgi:hypothetical protein